MIEDSIIIKGVGSFYEVLDHGKQITCKAKGSFRRDGITPLVGDRVRYGMKSMKRAMHRS